MSGPLRTVSWCEAHRGTAEDVQRVVVPEGQPRPDWGTHACRPCRRRLDLAAAPREPRKVARIQ